MAGKLVGEVIDAIEAGLTLSDAEFRALTAIAEKCHHSTRQGSVRTDRIVATTGKSQRTVERAISSLKERGLIRVMKRGGWSHGVYRAPVYELPVPATQMAVTPAASSRHPDGGNNVYLFPPNPDLFPPNQQLVTAKDPSATSNDARNDGSTSYGSTNDGLSDGGGSPPASPTPATTKNGRRYYAPNGDEITRQEAELATYFPDTYREHYPHRFKAGE